MPSFRLAVLGGGPIGAGVALLAMVNGLHVALWSRREETRRRARQEIEGGVAFRARRGTLPGPPGEVLSRLRLAPAVAEAVAGAQWMVEAVVEDVRVKHSVLREGEEASSPNAYLATTASWIPISHLARPLARPERFLGLHFFNPPWARRAVEVIPGEGTAPEALSAARDLLGVLKRTPAVLYRDTPGFVGNRLLLRQYEEAVCAVARGSTPDAIDGAYRFSLGFPFGPCESMDYVGLEFVLRLFHIAIQWGWDGPPGAVAFLEERVREGRTGPTTGEGFYPYPEKRWEPPSLRPSAGEGVDLAALSAPVVLEGARLVQKGVAAPEVVETIAADCIGWGGGPFAIGRRLGLHTLQDALARLYRQEPSERYRDEGSLGAVVSWERGGTVFTS